MSDETRIRTGAAVLWLLVGLAAVGGLVSWLRTAPSPSAQHEQPDMALVEGWAAAGFGSRFVAAYLVGDTAATGDLAAFLGFVPETVIRRPPPDQAPRPVAVVDLLPIERGYWAVTVVAGEPGRERFWRVGVVRRGRGFVATGLPTPTAVAPSAEAPELAVSVGDVPTPDDPAAQAVAGFLAAYVCGQGDVARYLAPDLTLSPVVPPLCTAVAINRWGSQPRGENGLSVVVEALLDPAVTAQPVSFALGLDRRDGRWEVGELLPAAQLATPPDHKEVER